MPISDAHVNDPARYANGLAMACRNRRARLAAACFALIAVVTTACGSTLPQAQQEATEIAGEQFGGLEEGTLPPGAHVNEKGQVVSAEGEVIGTADEFGIFDESSDRSATTTGEAAPVSDDRGSTTSAAANGPGVTSRTITLGFDAPKVGGVADSLGFQGALSFDYEGGWKALVEYQNAHGGIAGRKIIPVYYRWDAASSQTFAQREQEACAEWTQDHHVFAGLTSEYTDNILECMHDAGGVVITRQVADSWSSTPRMRKYPYYFGPVALNIDRVARLMVEGLDRMDYFSGDEKLGLVTFDDPNFKYAVQNGLIPALRDRGIELVDAAYLHRPGSASEYGQVANEATNAALRFKTEGIDHVLFLDMINGLGAWQFMPAAERQDYHPRYGLNSTSGNQWLVQQIGQDAGAQLHGALSIGWLPSTDVRDQDDPDTKDPTRELCVSIMRKAGVKMSGTLDESVALKFCDSLWSLAAALRGAGVINQATFLAGMEGIRGVYSPGATWSSFLAPTQHDGASSIANLRFVDECTCFKYTSRPYSIP